MINQFFAQKWKLTRKVLPFVGAIVLLKFATDYFGLEFLPLSTLFTAIISANIFLIGFLIKNLDNPFSYYEQESLSEEVSLKPLIDLQKRLQEAAKL